MRPEEVLNQKLFLEQINKLQLDKKLTWLEKNTKLMQLISIRDKLMKKKSEDLYKEMIQTSRTNNDEGYTFYLN